MILSQKKSSGSRPMCDVSSVGPRLSECREAGTDGSRFFQRLRPFKNSHILTGGDRRTAAAWSWCQVQFWEYGFPDSGFESSGSRPMSDSSTVGRRLSECGDAGADGSRFFQRLRPFKNSNILTGGDRRTTFGFPGPHEEKR